MESTIFNLGSSFVITVPKKFRPVAGTKAKFKKTGSKIIAVIDTKSKPITSQLQKDLVLVEKLAGGVKGKFDYTPDELNRRYESGTYGKTWK